MEPLFFKAENVFVPGGSESEVLLQWSRFFSKRKIEHTSDGLVLYEDASMEPLFFKAENLVNLPRAAYEKLLQWSRFFSKRKIDS